ncbi:hypothetical protein [Modestobacter excelsi]|uniref:hypothetical protein n=1 Tax=Modestobacter excelsi TaxID=2213161 RepID=UPI00110D0A6C|nr:hypothetical protein [Modestobacter excelsi]
MLDALAGWLGLALFGVALVLAAGLEVADQLVTAGRDRHDRPRRRRGRRIRWRLLHVALALVVLAVLGATVARFYVYIW